MTLLHLLTSLNFHREDLAIQIRLPDALDRKRNALSTVSLLQPTSNDSEYSFGVVLNLYRTRPDLVTMVYKLAIAVIVTQATRST